jgi:hypothetical protein
VTPQEVVAIVQTCIEQRRYRMTRHFQDRLEERKFFWGDVLAVIDKPTYVRENGVDDRGRDKWIFGGTSLDRIDLEIVIVIHQDETGNLSILVTIYYA